MSSQRNETVRVPVVQLAAAASLPFVLWHAGAATAAGALVVGVVAVCGVVLATRKARSAEARASLRILEVERVATTRGQRADEAVRMVVATLDALPDAILEIDAERQVVRANAAARGLLAATEGASLLSIVRDPDILAGIDDVLAGREAADIPFTPPGPVERHLVVHVLRLDLGAAARSRAMLLYRDVTALRNADRLRADFVANVSHELRTPLASLSGFIETLLGPARDDEPARLRFLEIMEGEARRMTRLVSDLLSLSRIEASEHAVPTDPVDVLPIVARVVDALAPVASPSRSTSLQACRRSPATPTSSSRSSRTWSTTRSSMAAPTARSASVRGSWPARAAFPREWPSPWRMPVTAYRASICIALPSASIASIPVARAGWAGPGSASRS
jgi:signal transduction histidine kinase